MAAEGRELGVEEGMLWLPSQVLNEACDVKVYMRQQQQKPPYLQRHRRNDRVLLSPSEFALPLHQKSKYSNISRQYQKQKPAGAAANFTAGGPGMQAIFLDSGRQLGGTGVFLPRGAGTGYQPNKKPACSMVLLPARVVQALNLDVQAFGLQISPRKDPKSNQQKGRECNSVVKNEKGKDVTSTHCSFMSSQNQTNSSQEIFLPKEWTY